jgi:hypothetical protein
MNPFEYPVVKIIGGESWSSAYDAGRELEALFSGQDAFNFCVAVSEHHAPYEEVSITKLVMIQEGENDGNSWIWHVTFDNGETWTAEGWCDYTGWDCQSNLTWALHH